MMYFDQQGGLTDHRADGPALTDSMNGLALVQAITDGRLPVPPMVEQMPFEVEAVSQGAMILRARPEARFFNDTSTIHGGWSMTMLDTVMALSALTTASPGEKMPSHETTVKFVRAITLSTGMLRILGTVVSRGRTLVTLEGRIEDMSGRLYAHGTSTCVALGRAVDRNATPRSD